MPDQTGKVGKVDFWRLVGAAKKVDVRVPYSNAGQ